MVDQEKPKRRWQNLIHQKCPNCDSRLQDKKQYFGCPNPDPKDPKKSCFFIKKERLAELLQDESHPAHFCLTEHEKNMIDDAVNTILNPTRI